MDCPSCGQPNPEDARFCGHCGASLAPDLTCRNCGRSNPPSIRFCHGCGQPLAAPTSAPSTPETPLPTTPTSFAGGRYQVARFLGEGGKKRVYLAHDTKLDRDVAFALIKTEGLDDEGRQRIQREAQAMGRLGTHPHIVSVYDMGEEPGNTGTQEPGGGEPRFPGSHVPSPYLVTEFMPGGDVERLLERAPDHRLPIEEAVSIAQQICRGLQFAHDHGLVHRDLKPGNVWLTGRGPIQSPISKVQGPNQSPGGEARGPQSAQSVKSADPFLGGAGVAKLGDFGLAVALDRSRLTRAGMMVGTPRYMAPEQALGREANPRSDLYALGAMLYEMVSGRPPFLGEDAIAVISQHINTPPVAPSWHNSQCPAGLESLILHLLAKMPDERPASALEVLAALNEIDLTAAAPAAHENPLERLARGVFVGRERELARLRSAFDQAFAGHGNVAMLVGEPGIGKTRTAMEVETYARMRGAQVLWGRAHEAAGAPPYWPWVQALRSYVASVGPEALRSQLGSEGPEVARIVSEVRERLPGLPEAALVEDPEGAQFRLFDAVYTFLRNASGSTPLLIVLDDLHWADKPTLLLLEHLAREIGRSRIMVLGTYRDVEVSRAHPLAATLADLAREQLFQRVLLRGLSREEVEAYIRASVNIDPARELLQSIFEETEGNPFFVTEVVALMVQEGTLGASGGQPGRALTVPQSVREVLGRRLDRLSEECNDLLRLAAVAGRDFGYDLLGALQLSPLSPGEGQGEGDDRLLELVEEALLARVVQETERPGEYRFTHALIQETLLAEVSTTRRVRLHGRIAETLETLYGDRVERHAAELAHHFLESATLTRRHARQAADYSRLAADQADTQTAWDEAARHYQNCLELVLDSEDDMGQDRAGLLYGLGRCWAYTGEEALGRQAVLCSLELFRERGDGVRLARAALQLLHTGAADLTLLERRRLASEALEVVGETDPHLKALLLTYRASGTRDAGEDAVAREAATQAAGMARSHGFADVESRLLLGQANEARDQLRFGDAITAAEGAWAAFKRSGALHPLGIPGAWVMTLLYAGRLDEAERVSVEAAEHFRRAHIRPNEFTFLGRQAIVALLRGDLSRTNELVQRAPPGRYPMAQLEAALHELTGEFEAALAAVVAWQQAQEGATVALPTNVTRLLPAAHQSTTRYLTGDKAEALACRARIHFNMGALQKARRDLAAWAAGLEPWQGQNPLGMRSARRWRSFAELDECLPALGDDAQVETAFRELVALGPVRFIGRPCDRLRGALALRLGRVDEAEAYYRQALEWTTQERCPIEQGRCLQGLATIAEQRASPREAAAFLDEAGALFREYGAVLYLKQVLAKRELLNA